MDKSYLAPFWDNECLLNQCVEGSHLLCTVKEATPSGRKVGPSSVVKCLLRNANIVWAPYRLVDQQKQNKQGNLSK